MKRFGQGGNRRRQDAAVVGLVLIAAAMVLGATVFREGVAQAASAILKVREQNLDVNGNIKVHEQGTVSVKPIVNDLVSVRAPGHLGGDGPSRSEFDILYTVPAGKTLVAQYANVYFGAWHGVMPGVGIQVLTTTATLQFVQLDLHKTGAIDNTARKSYEWVASDPVTLYAPAGSTVRAHVRVFAEDSTVARVGGDYHIALSGHLVDAP